MEYIWMFDDDDQNALKTSRKTAIDVLETWCPLSMIHDIPKCWQKYGNWCHTYIVDSIESQAAH